MSDTGSPVDLERLHLTSDGDKEFEEELFELFDGDCSERVARLARAITGQDTEMLVHEAHTIKGAAANIGADLMRNLALKLEKYDTARGWEDAAALHKELEDSFDAVRAFMKAYFAQ